MNDKKYSSGQVLNLFGGEIRTLNESEESAICEALSMLPITMVHDVLDHVWFLSMDGLYGLNINLDVLKVKSLIMLSQSFNSLDDEDQIRIVLHELGHYFEGRGAGESAAEAFVERYYTK